MLKNLDLIIYHYINIYRNIPFLILLFQYSRHSEGHQKQAKEILDLKDSLEILNVNLLPEDPILSTLIEVDFQISMSPILHGRIHKKEPLDQNREM